MSLYDINGNEILFDSESSPSGSSVSELQRKFKGKNIVWLGDSIHAYSQPDGVTIPYLFEYHSGAKCYNWCQGGTTMAKMGVANYDPFSGVGMIDALVTGAFTDQETYQEDRNFSSQVSEMKSFDMSTADYVIIEFGTNDTLKDITLDNSENTFDTTTTGGSLRYMIKTLQTVYPKLGIAVCNVQKMTGWLDSEHTKSYNSKNQTDLINLVCSDLCIPIIDIYNLIGLNDYTSETLLSDNLHRSHAGKLKQVQVIENRMVDFY
ncbi:MAG: SGNH/GDSL hydrolase family protein [Bariatricus sp.]